MTKSNSAQFRLQKCFVCLPAPAFLHMPNWLSSRVATMPALMTVTHMVCGSSEANTAEARSPSMQNTMYSGADTPIVTAGCLLSASLTLPLIELKSVTRALIRDLRMCHKGYIHVLLVTDVMRLGWCIFPHRCCCVTLQENIYLRLKWF